MALQHQIMSTLLLFTKCNETLNALYPLFLKNCVYLFPLSAYHFLLFYRFNLSLLAIVNISSCIRSSRPGQWERHLTGCFVLAVLLQKLLEVPIFSGNKVFQSHQDPCPQTSTAPRQGTLSSPEACTGQGYLHTFPYSCFLL